SERARPAPADGAAPEPPGANDQAIDRVLDRSLMLLASTTAGVAIAPVFTVVSVPFLIYQTLPLYRLAYDEMTVRGKIGGACIRALTATGLLAAGAFWISALSAVLFASTEKLQRKVQSSSRRGLSHVFGELPRRVWLRRDAIEVEIGI